MTSWSACSGRLLYETPDTPLRPSPANKSAVSSIQHTQLSTPVFQLRHANLTISDDYRRMPLDYASYQVVLYWPEGAIITHERGRALLGSEMRHFRTSIDQLVQADPQLRHMVVAVNRDLVEELTKSLSPSFNSNTNDGIAGDLRAVGRSVVSCRSNVGFGRDGASSFRKFEYC